MSYTRALSMMFCASRSSIYRLVHGYSHNSNHKSDSHFSPCSHDDIFHKNEISHGPFPTDKQATVMDRERTKQQLKCEAEETKKLEDETEANHWKGPRYP